MNTINQGKPLVKFPGNSMITYSLRKEQMRVAQVCHVDVTSGHFGVAKTVASIKERFMWKGILSD